MQCTYKQAFKFLISVEYIIITSGNRWNSKEVGKGRACSVTHQSNPLGVTTKRGQVLAQPMQTRHQVH